MFSWMQALADAEEDRDDRDPPEGGIGLSGMPLPSPLNPSREGGSAYAQVLAPQRPVSRAKEDIPGPPPLPAPVTPPTLRGDAGAMAGMPGASPAPQPAARDRERDFEPLPAPTFGALTPTTPPPPLDFSTPQPAAPAMPVAPQAMAFGAPTSPTFETPQAAAFPAMTPPPPMPAPPSAPPPLQFAELGASGFGAAPGTGMAGMTGTTTGTTAGTTGQTGQATTGTTGTQQQQSGFNTDFNKALAALGLGKTALNTLNQFLPSATAPATSPLPQESLFVDPLGGPQPPPDPEWFFPPPPPVTPTNNPEWFVDPLGGPPVDAGRAPTTAPTTSAPTTSTGPGQSLIGQGVEAVLGPEAGAMVNSSLPYIGAVLSAAMGLASGQPVERAILGSLPALMQSPGVQNLITSSVGAALGTQAAGLVTQSLPYVGQVLSFGMALAGGQDAGQAALNAAIGIAAAALAPETAGLSVVVGAVLQYLLGGIGGPSEHWLDFGKRVGETVKTNISAVDTLVPEIIAAKTPEELEAARAKYIATLYQGKLDPETSQPMAFTPHDGEYLPGMPGATGTQHEWGKNFNPNELNAALNHLYGTKLTSLTQGVGDPNQAMNYLMGILPMIQHGATGVGANPGQMPALYSSMTPAGPSLPALTPPPVEPLNAHAWTGSA